MTKDKIDLERILSEPFKEGTTIYLWGTVTSTLMTRKEAEEFKRFIEADVEK